MEKIARRLPHERFEFVFTVNDNIICQRYFNVPNYNSDVLKSWDLKDVIDNCVTIIMNDLKEKSIESIWGYYNPYIIQTELDIKKAKSKPIRPHDFSFEISVDGRCVGKKKFNGNIYPPNIRYQVNIKDLIDLLIVEIQETFSKDYFELVDAK